MKKKILSLLAAFFIVAVLAVTGAAADGENAYLSFRADGGVAGYNVVSSYNPAAATDVSGDTRLSFRSGCTVYVTPKAKAGYVIDTVLLDGVPLTPVNGKYEVPHGTADQTLEIRTAEADGYVTYEVDAGVHKYEVTRSDNPAVAISNPEKQKIRHGATVTVRVYLQTGYVIDSVSLDGKTVYASGDTVTFTHGSLDQVLSIRTAPANGTIAFEIDGGVAQYGIRQNPSYEISTTESLRLSFRRDTSVFLTPTAKAGYVIDAVLLDGQPISAVNGEYTIQHGSTDQTVSIRTKMTDGTVTFVVDAGVASYSYMTDYNPVSISSTSNTKVKIRNGAAVLLNVSVKPGYRIDSVLLDGQPLTAVNGDYSFRQTNLDRTLTVTTSPIPVYVDSALTVSADEGLAKFRVRVDYDPSYAREYTVGGVVLTLRSDSTVYFLPTAKNGYAIDAVLLDGQPLTAVNGEYAVPHGSADQNLTVRTKELSSEVVFSVDGGVTGYTVAQDGSAVQKSFSASARETYAQGVTLRVKITVKDGYEIDSVLLDGAVLTPVSGAYVISHGSAAQTLTVRTKALPVVGSYSLTTAVNGGHGTVSAGTKGIPAGTRVTVVFTPENGYEIGTVTVNGSTVQVTGNSLTLTVNGDVSLTVTYRKTGPAPATTYTVTFVMNGHGTQVAAQTVNEGSAASAPAEPSAAGYLFAGWFSDAALTEPFVFGRAINANVTVYAKWTPVSVETEPQTNPETEPPFVPETEPPFVPETGAETSSETAGAETAVPDTSAETAGTESGEPSDSETLRPEGTETDKPGSREPFGKIFSGPESYVPILAGLLLIVIILLIGTIIYFNKRIG